MTFDEVERAIDAVGRGEFVVVVDDEDRENEGDLIIAADRMTPEKMAFMIRFTSGVICLPMEGARLDELRLPLMVSGTENTEGQRTAFTVSVDAKHGTSTGISAADRTTTVRTLIGDETRSADLARPGHIFPLRYREGGVLKRAGHTEAAVDLARLAGRYPAGVLSEIVNDDGTMQRRPELEQFAAEHDLVLVTIADLIRYRRHREKLVRRVSQARIPTQYGDFTAHVFESLLDGVEHLAFVRGELAGHENVLVRVHSECLTGDVFGSMRCDCGTQLDRAMARVGGEERGVVVYLRGHEGRGIGLGHKLRAYTLQDEGRDTVEANLELGFPADSREYGIGAQILVDLGVTTMRLMTNNPAKYGGIEGYGLEIVERVPVQTEPTSENIAYLRAKQRKLGHLLGFDPDSGTEPDTELGGLMGEYSGSEGTLDATGMRFAIVAARFNNEVTEPLCAGAEKTLRGHGAAEVSVVWVPGAFELPLVAKRFAQSGTVDAVVCIGAVIRGETPHFEYVAGECAAGVSRAALDTGIPIAFGVLTVEDRKQAFDRVGGAEGHKGEEAACTAIEMVARLREIPARKTSH